MNEIERLIESLSPGEKQALFEKLKVELGKSTPADIVEGFTAVDTAWEAPADYVITFDGGSRGNPGPGYGSYALSTHSDRRRVRRFEFGIITSNEAEYKTLLKALTELMEVIERAGKSPAEFTVEIRGDSTLVINQVLGRWKTKAPRLKALRDQTRRLLGCFKAYRMVKVPREEVRKELGH